jgi:hypothetical protein
MEVQDVIDTIDAAPENLREFYVPGKDANVGKFVFDPAASVAGLKKNKTDILTEKQKLEQKYQGVDLDEYNKWRTDQATLADKKLKDKGDWDAKEASLKTAHQTELATEKSRQEKTFKSLEKVLITNATQNALIEAKVIRGREKVLLPHITGNLKVIEVDGEFVARVVDGTGQVRYQNGSEMTIAQLVAELKGDDSFSDNFEAKEARGSGANPGGQNRKPGASETRQDGPLNPTNRLKDARRTTK